MKINPFNQCKTIQQKNTKEGQGLLQINHPLLLNQVEDLSKQENKI